MKKIISMLAIVVATASVCVAAVPGVLEVMTHNMYLGNDGRDLFGAEFPAGSAYLMNLYDDANGNILFSEMSSGVAGFFTPNQIYWPILPTEAMNGKNLGLSLVYNGTAYDSNRTTYISWNSSMPDPSVGGDFGQITVIVPEPMTMILTMLGGLGLVTLRPFRRK